MAVAPWLVGSKTRAQKGHERATLRFFGHSLFLLRLAGLAQRSSIKWEISGSSAGGMG
jgi:hypothetical protein